MKDTGKEQQKMFGKFDTTEKSIVKKPAKCGGEKTISGI